METTPAKPASNGNATATTAAAADAAPAPARLPHKSSSKGLIDESIAKLGVSLAALKRHGSGNLVRLAPLGAVMYGHRSFGRGAHTSASALLPAQEIYHLCGGKATSQSAASPPADRSPAAF